MNGGGLGAARAALARGDVILAYDAASEVLLEDPADLEARYVAALALVRAGARERARLAIDDLHAAHALAERARALVRAVADEPGEGYWAAATDAEAALVLGDVEGAQAALEIAATMGAGDVAARAVTARQLRVLCETAGIDPGILDALALPGVLHFCGHRVTANPEKAGGFAADDEPAVAAAVSDFLSNRSFDGAYGALACGADIIIAEAALEHGVPLHVVLPFGIDDFEEVSVRSGGAGWPERYRSCLERAASVFVAYDSAY